MNEIDNLINDTFHNLTNFQLMFLSMSIVYEVIQKEGDTTLMVWVLMPNIVARPNNVLDIVTTDGSVVSKCVWVLRRDPTLGRPQLAKLYVEISRVG